MKKDIIVKIIGIGGAGGNIISRMPRNFAKSVEFIALNTDLQDLKNTKADYKIQLGGTRTQGFGTGMDPKKGREAAIVSKKEIQSLIQGSDIIFIICGLGGGTGSGASPIIAEMARETGALTIGIATFPFYFEGAQRKKIAKNTLPILEERADSLILIYNDKIFSYVKEPLNLESAFFLIDKTIYEIVNNILSLITTPGLINVDLADLNSIMRNSKRAFFGIGKGEGKEKIKQAAYAALNSPFLNASIEKAKGILFNVSGGKNLTLFDIEETAKIITEKSLPDTKIIFGAIQDTKKFRPDQVQITLLATGI